MIAARALSAVQSISAAEKVRIQRENQSQWPYVHIFPPPNSLPVHAISLAVAVPAKGVTVVVLTYTVPDGMRLFLRSLIQTYSGGAISPGDLLWTVTQNQPAGIADVQGAPVQGLISSPVPLGSWAFGIQWPFERVYEFAPNQVIRSTCQNSTGNIPAGAPNLLVSGFFGWLVPDVEVRR